MKLANIFRKPIGENAIAVTIQLLKRLNVKVTESAVSSAMEYHPDYPSLFSISDSLNRWHVNNLALQVKAEQLHDLPLPFIAHLKKGSGYFTLVTKLDSESIFHISENGKEVQQKKNLFIEKWSGIVLVAEADEKSGEVNYKKQRREELFYENRLLAVLVALITFSLAFNYVSIPVNSPLSFLPLVLLQLKIVGSLVTGILLWYEIDKSNPLLKEICSGGTKTNCDAVLDSKGSKLFGLISWSEIGFFYFASGLLFLLISTANVTDAFNLLSWLALLACPYILYSVFYQWRIVKKWCPLCLLVQGILALESVVAYWGFRRGELYLMSYKASTFYHFIFVMALILVSWLLIKPLLLKAQQVMTITKENIRLKYNSDIFQTLLVKQKLITELPLGLGITLGNPEAKHTLIKVCNPYCNPCAKAHPVLEQLLASRSDIKVQIIFTAMDDDRDRRAEPVKHLMAISEKGDNELMQKALGDWYNANEKNYQAFAAKYVMNGALKTQGHKLQAMYKWCETTNVEFTPTYFLNGYQLPELYKLNDLKYLIS